MVREQEIQELSRTMAAFGVSFTDISDHSPKQERTLEACSRVVQYAIQNRVLLEELAERLIIAEATEVTAPIAMPETTLDSESIENQDYHDSLYDEGHNSRSGQTPIQAPLPTGNTQDSGEQQIPVDGGNSADGELASAPADDGNSPYQDDASDDGQSSYDD